MGKFDGVLIISDYDNTISFTEGALAQGLGLPPLSPENRRALLSFMDRGGTFCVATGRALPAFAPIAPTIPSNGPSILFNGAAIYDFSRGEYLYTSFLPESVRSPLEDLFERFPQLGMEIYHDDFVIHAVRPNEVTRRHLGSAHLSYVEIPRPAYAPSPISKVLLQGDPEVLAPVLDYLHTVPWASDYEIVSSSTYLVEVTAMGANKGCMVEKLVSLLGVDPAHVYCAGDHANDIPMLRLARIPFAPANAIPAVHQVPGIHILPHSQDSAIAAMIDELDKLY
ncbi:MAG: HAD-IIB family hydrolase [Oscillospiraceae bacterium]|nr:HAD-IIB family hydrolase [Oscillospiraceae bacterium]